MSKSRWAFMKRLVVGPEQNPMLVRWRLVSTPWGGIYLHFIAREDLDRDPHNHPWRFASLVLRGGYVEELWVNPTSPHRAAATGVHKRWSLHDFSLDWAHRITSVKPGTVTLVFVGPKVKEWGFFTDKGWVPWHAYQSKIGVWSDEDKPEMQERLSG